MAALDILSAIGNVKSMLSALADWQAICGVSTSTDAAKRIHKGGIEETAGDTLCPCCVVDMADQAMVIDCVPRRSSALGIECRFQLAIPATSCKTYAQQYEYTWEKMGLLSAGIAAAVNGAGGLDMTSLQITQRPGPIDPDENDNRVEWAFTLLLNLRIV